MLIDSFTRNGRFEVEGKDLSDLLHLSQTPFYVYSGGVIRSKHARLTRALPGMEVFYSLKANPNPAICRLLRSLGARAEVSSIAELRTVLKAGFRPENIIFLGPGKTEREIRAVLNAGVYAMVVESAQELLAIERLAARDMTRSARRSSFDARRSALHKPCVLLRINTLEQPTGAREVMVGGPSKFGFDEETVVSEVRGLPLRYVRLLGFQDYSASQVLDAEVIGGHFAYLLRLAPRLAREIGFRLRCIDFGGGFGIPYEPNQSELDMEKLSCTIGQLLKKHAADLDGCRLLVESGRYLVAESGVFVTQVVRTKESRGRRFIIADGGINHFARPAFMHAAHQVRVLNRVMAPPEHEYEVCGPLCTPIDVLASGCPLPDPEPGELLGVFDAGAYGFSMSFLRFLSFGTPGELLLDRGKALYARRRTT
jgi:diaminopimelate decarboxylase